MTVCEGVVDLRPPSAAAVARLYEIDDGHSARPTSTEGCSSCPAIGRAVVAIGNRLSVLPPQSHAGNHADSVAARRRRRAGGHPPRPQPWRWRPWQRPSQMPRSRWTAAILRTASPLVIGRMRYCGRRRRNNANLLLQSHTFLFSTLGDGQCAWTRIRGLLSNTCSAATLWPCSLLPQKLRRRLRRLGAPRVLSGAVISRRKVVCHPLPQRPTHSPHTSATTRSYTTLSPPPSLKTMISRFLRQSGGSKRPAQRPLRCNFPRGY